MASPASVNTDKIADDRDMCLINDNNKLQCALHTACSPSENALFIANSSPRRSKWTVNAFLGNSVTH